MSGDLENFPLCDKVVFSLFSIILIFSGLRLFLSIFSDKKINSFNKD